MKTITCLHCEEQFASDTPEAIQTKMLPHYKEVHADVMASNTDESKKEWFKEFNTRFEAAKEMTS